jgi:dTMP kinase
MSAMAGRFITLEGGEGAGKSTQMRLLAAGLRRGGLEVVETREPGGSPAAERIRAFLLEGGAKTLGANAEAALFAAARFDHVESLIRPALARGAWVICDRFMDSTRAYQGAAGGAAPQFVAGLEQAAVGVTRPDLTLLLDAPAELGLARAAARRNAAAADRFEGERASFHEALRSAFLALAAENPERFVIIDARGSVETIAAAIAQTVSARFRLGELTA